MNTITINIIIVIVCYTHNCNDIGDQADDHPPHRAEQSVGGLEGLQDLIYIYIYIYIHA